mgnify:CR=1 FL=1
MEENAVVNLIAMETAAPKRKLNRSAGAVYVALIALIIGSISLGNLLYARWLIPRYVTQPALYVLIALGCLYVYRRHFLSYRYTLTDEMLAIERIGGNGERAIAAVSLHHIRRIAGYRRAGNTTTRIVNAALPPRGMSTLVTVRENARETVYRIGASEDFAEKLTAQWRKAMAQKER